MQLRSLLGSATLVAAALTPAASFAQYNGVPIISTTMGGIVSGTYGYFKYISTTYGGLVSDRLTSGTTSMVAQAASNIISITTNGTNTGYFNSNGVLTVPGISATANLTSVTSLYASGNVNINSTGSNPLLVNNATPSATTIVRINDGPDILNSNYMLLGNDPTGGFAGYAQGGQFIATGTNGTGTARDLILMNFDPGKTIQFATNHTERMRIDSTGKVGIGTASPIAALDVRGAIEGSYYSSPNDTWLYSYNGAAQGAVRSGINFLGASNTMVFYTNQAERMRIGSGGGVGIGTTSIAYPFVVSGTGRFNTTLDSYPAVYATASGNTYGVYAEASHASGAAVKGIHTTNGSNGILGLLTTGVYGTGAGSGSWGVQGTSSVYGGVYGQGNTYGVYGYATGSSSNAVYGQTTGSNGVGVYGYNSSTGAYGGLGYVGYGVYASSINSYGVYGTSTNSWGGYFVGNSVSAGGVYGNSTNGYGVTGVSGNVGVRGDSANSWGGYFTGNASGFGGVYGLSTVAFGVYGQSTSGYGLYGTVSGSGGVAVYGGNTSSGAYGGVGWTSYGIWCGAGTCGGANAWTVSSDARLKDRIKNLPNNWGLAAIEKLRPVTYHWRDVKRDKKEGEQIGFIAQEVSPVLPALVMQDKGTSTTITVAGNKAAYVQDPMSIKYDLLAVPLVKAVQELKADNDNLRADNDNLRNANGSLQRQVNNLGAAVESLQRQVRVINERDATAHGRKP